MRRRLFNLAAVFSLVLFLVMALFCVRAQCGSNDYIEFRSRHHNVPPDIPDLTTDAGRAVFEEWDRRQWSVHIRANPNAIFVFGRQAFFGYPRNSFDVHFYYGIWLPALALVPATVALRDLRHSRRTRRGRCPTCGYDLRATPQGGRCPECGSVPPDPPPIAARPTTNAPAVSIRSRRLEKSRRPPPEPRQHGPCPSP